MSRNLVGHDFQPCAGALTVAQEDLTDSGFVQRMLQHPLLRSFMLFAIFRAFYGAGILVVTWFLASETEAPLWVSILFLLGSMVFSRLLFRGLKRLGSDSPTTPN